MIRCGKWMKEFPYLPQIDPNRHRIVKFDRVVSAPYLTGYAVIDKKTGRTLARFTKSDEPKARAFARGKLGRGCESRTCHVDPVHDQRQKLVETYGIEDVKTREVVYESLDQKEAEAVYRGADPRESQWSVGDHWKRRCFDETQLISPKKTLHFDVGFRSEGKDRWYSILTLPNGKKQEFGPFEKPIIARGAATAESNAWLTKRQEEVGVRPAIDVLDEAQMNKYTWQPALKQRGLAGLMRMRKTRRHR